VQAQAMATKEVLILCFETDGSLKLPPVQLSNICRVAFEKGPFLTILN
jgi:hypothetical protein